MFLRLEINCPLLETMSLISVDTNDSCFGDSQLQCLLAFLAFPTRTDCSIVGDRVSLHTFIQHSFEELQGLLALPAILTSTDSSFVSY